MDQNINWVLIAKKLQNALSIEESYEFDDLLKEHNFSLAYRAAVAIWNNSEKIGAALNVAGTSDLDGIITTLKTQIEQQQAPLTQYVIQKEKKSTSGPIPADVTLDTIWDKASRLGQKLHQQPKPVNLEKALVVMEEKIAQITSDATNIALSLDASAETSLQKIYLPFWKLADVVGGKAALTVTQSAQDRAITAMRDKITALESAKTEKTKVVTFKKAISKNKLGNGFLKIAAAVLLLVGISFIFYSVFQSSDIAITESAHIRLVTLPDGTRVWLEGKESYISYPKVFEGNTRAVGFSGKAFFDVRPNADKPFIIRTNLTETEVVGTAFMLEASPQSQKQIIKLIQGKVKFTSLEQRRTITLAPNQVATYDLASTSLSLQNADLGGLASIIRSHIKFRNAPFSEVLEIIGLAYGVSFELMDESFAERRFTGKFKNKTLDLVLSHIGLAMRVNFHREKNTIKVFADPQRDAPVN